jgi:hypothetical protein
VRMCNITMTSVGSVLNFAYAGVPVRYVAFSTQRICITNLTAVIVLFNLAPCMVQTISFRTPFEIGECET